MTSIRLEKKTLEFDGRVWEICCNMAVLDALQEAHGGSFGALAEMDPIKSVTEVLAAMLNDYAEDMDWKIRCTPRMIAKMVPLAAMKDLDVMGMFWRSVSPDAAEDSAEAAPEGVADPGN